MRWNRFVFSSIRRNRKRLDMLLNYKKEGRLLDIGCGECCFVTLANQYFQSEGIDILPVPIDLCDSTSTPKITKADIYDIDFEDEVYDVITSFNLIEHLYDPYLAIQKVYGGLKPGGVFFGSVPNNSLLIGKIHTFLANLFDSTHCSTFHPTRWLEYLDGVGFRNILFFGELLLGSISFYCMVPKLYRFVSFNLMFLCRKN